MGLVGHSQTVLPPEQRIHSLQLFSRAPWHLAVTPLDLRAATPAIVGEIRPDGSSFAALAILLVLPNGIVQDEDHLSP